MGVSKLRFVVESLRAISVGGYELDGLSLQGLNGIMEDACMEIEQDYRHMNDKIVGLEQASAALSKMKGKEIAERLIRDMDK